MDGTRGGCHKGGGVSPLSLVVEVGVCVGMWPLSLRLAVDLQNHPHSPRRVFDPPEADLWLSSASLRPWPSYASAHLRPIGSPLRNCKSRLWCHPDNLTYLPPLILRLSSARAAPAPPARVMQTSHRGRGDTTPSAAPGQSTGGGGVVK